MSIFKNLFAQGKKNLKLQGEKMDIDREEMTRCLNVFIAGYRLSIQSDFLDLVCEKAGLSEQEKKDIILTVNNKPLENNLPMATNLANIDDLRAKIVDAIRKLDVADITY